MNREQILQAATTAVETSKQEGEYLAGSQRSTYTGGCSWELALNLLETKIQGVHVPDNIFEMAIYSLNKAFSHSHTWKTIKPDRLEIVKTFLFPLLCYSDDDEEMWKNDVLEYFKIKFCSLYQFQALLTAISKRKGTMKSILGFVIQILAGSQNPREIHGALCMIGELAIPLGKSEKNKMYVENLLYAHVVGRLNDGARFVRARAAWCLKTFSSFQFQHTDVLKKVFDGLVKRLCDPVEELPCKLESAIGIQFFLKNQGEKMHEIARPFVKEIIPKVLELLAQTRIEDVCGVMDQLIKDFMDDVIPSVVELSEQLCSLFLNVVRKDITNDEVHTLMGIISTLTNILNMVDQREIMVQVESRALKIIKVVFNNSKVEYYDDVLMLIQSLTASYISEPMWEVLCDVYNMFKQDKNTICFTELMPCLYQYVTVDTKAFLAHPERLNAILEMCQLVLQDPDQGEDNQLNASKIVECVLLHCSGNIDEAFLDIMPPSFERLIQPFAGLSDLRPLLILVLVATFYTNHELATLCVDHLGSLDYLPNKLINLSLKWEGVHGRMVTALIWCKLLRSPVDQRPLIIRSLPHKVIESCVSMFEGLGKAIKAQADNARFNEKESDDESDYEDLGDFEDDIDEETLEYLESLAIKHQKRSWGDDDSEDDDDTETEGTLEYLESLAKERKRQSWGDHDTEDDDETEAEMNNAPLNEDIAASFKKTMEAFEQHEITLIQRMVGTLDLQGQEGLKKLMKVCAQHAQLVESKNVEQ